MAGALPPGDAPREEHAPPAKAVSREKAVSPGKAVFPGMIVFHETKVQPQARGASKGAVPSAAVRGKIGRARAVSQAAVQRGLVPTAIVAGMIAFGLTALIVLLLTVSPLAVGMGIARVLIASMAVGMSASARVLIRIASARGGGAPTGSPPTGAAVMG